MTNIMVMLATFDKALINPPLLPLPPNPSPLSLLLSSSGTTSLITRFAIDLARLPKLEIPFFNSDNVLS